MKTRLFVENPDSIEMTLKVTMTVKDWCALRDQLSDSWPSWKLTASINDLLSQARKIFIPSTPEDV